MKKIVFILWILLATLDATEPWFVFEDPKSGLLGYKDKRGHLRVAPTFHMAPARFDNIIGVIGKDYQASYLFKHAKPVHNKLYFYDNSPDCESEGTIRFKDKGKVGILSKEGNVLIPAIYSAITPVKNHLFMALYNAKKVCHDGKDYNDNKPCEHPFFQGGKTFLMHDSNRVIVENFTYTTDLNWYDYEVGYRPSSHPLRDSFKGVDGKYYTFKNSKKEFEAWFLNEFRQTFHQSHDTLIFKKLSVQQLESLSSAKQLAAVEKIMHELKHHTFYILSNDMALYAWDNPRLQNYFDACGRLKAAQYPGFTVVVEYDIGGEYYQKHLEFFKTEDRYRLIDLYIPKALQ